MRNKSLKTNAILNTIKQCCTVIIPLITYPYVSRALGAANYGKFSFSDSIINILMVIASLGIPTYAVREGSRIRDDYEKIKKFASEIYSINIAAMIGTYILAIWLILNIDRLGRNAVVTYLLSINILSSVIGKDWINTIYEDFRFITIRYILFQIMATVFIFVFVHKPSDYIIYTCVMLFANSGGYFLNYFYTKRYIKVRLTWKVHLKKHIKPILYLFGVALAIQIYVRSDIAVLGFLRSDREVGIYTLTTKIYTVVKSLLNAVIVVTIPRLSNYLGTGKEGEYNRLLNKLRQYLHTLIFPCVVGLFLESKNVMLLMGGKEYNSGTAALEILCVALGFAVLGCFYSQGVLVPNRREKYFFLATIVSAVENIVLNIILIPYWGMAGAAFTTVLAEFLVVAISKYFIRDVYKAKWNRDAISILVGCLGIIGVCLAVNQLKINYLISLGVSIIGSTIVYAVILIAMKNEAMKDLVQSLLKRIKR